MSLTHAQILARRRQMAADVESGADPDVVVQRYGVTLALVQKSCREFGVSYPRRTALCASSTFRVLARLIASAEPYSEIGKSMNVSKQRVYQIAKMARDAGIHIPERTQGVRSWTDPASISPAATNR